MNTPKYILHASPEKDKEGKNVPKLIKKGGFKYIKGRPTTSSDISYIALHATDLGQRKGEKPETKGQLWHIFCMDLPKDKHVGTSAHGNIEIIDDEEKKKFNPNYEHKQGEKEQKEISGKPTTRMSGRSQRGIYDKGEKPPKENVFSKPDWPKKTITKKHIALEIIPTPKIIAIADKLREKITDFKPINIPELKAELMDALDKESIIYQKNE